MIYFFDSIVIHMSQHESGRYYEVAVKASELFSYQENDNFNVLTYSWAELIVSSTQPLFLSYITFFSSIRFLCLCVLETCDIKL